MKLINSLILSAFLLLFSCINSSNNYPNPADGYNVRNFGAKGDGKTDDTKAIQTAVNTVFDAGGGTVYFPNGIYLINGPVIDSVDHHYCSSQLFIPFSDMEHSRTITFRGEAAPDFEMQGITEVSPSVCGAILLSGIISADSNDAVIGELRGIGEGWLPWNCTTPCFYNLGVRTRSVTDTTQTLNAMGGINLRYASKCIVENILIDREGPMSRLMDPLPSGSCGLVCPEANNHAQVSIGLIRVGGYATGIKFSEHFVAKDVQVCCCNTGVVAEFGHHSSSIQTLEIECCTRSILFAPGHNLFVANYNTEHFPSGKWFAYGSDIVFAGKCYYTPKIIIGLCHPVVSGIGYEPEHFNTNDKNRVVLLEKTASK